MLAIRQNVRCPGQVEDTARQPCAVCPAPRLDVADTLREQAGCTPGREAPVSFNALEAWGHRAYEPLYQSDWVRMDLQTSDAATVLCTFPQPPRRAGVVVLQSCQGELGPGSTTPSF